MKNKVIRLAAIAGSMLFCCGFPVIGQEVSVQFTGGYTTTWGNSSGDYGAGIYSANINGAPSASGMICDDFNDDITSGESWTANAYQASSLTTSNIDETLFGATIHITGYAEIGTLVSMMFGNISTYGSLTGITQAELASAIWDIGIGGTLQGLDAKAQSLVVAVEAAFAGPNGSANAQAYLATLKNLWILTPNPEGPGEPQEMWTEGLSVPEGGAALMYLLLAAASCFGAMFLSSRKQVAGRVTY